MSLIFAFAHDTLAPSLVTTFIIVGIVFIGGAVTGRSFEIAGVAKIGEVFGWKRQLAVGVFGLAVLAFGLWSSSAEDWLRSYNELVKEADDHAISAGLRDQLGLLVDRSGNNKFRNCRIADFIADHPIPSPPPSLARKLDAAQHGNNRALSCYVKKVADAQQTLSEQTAMAISSPQPTSGAVPSPQPTRVFMPAPTPTNGVVHLATPASAVTPLPRASSGTVLASAPPSGTIAARETLRTASSRTPTVELAKSLLKAATGPGQLGWLYLGRIVGGKLADATIFERFPNEHQLITLTTDVALHDPHASSNFSKSPIVGVVPAWSQVSVQQFRRSADYLWARVQVVRNGSTNAARAPGGGLRLARRECPVRRDRDAVRTNTMQWVILGAKAGDSDRLLSPNVDAFCIPRNGEVVTLTKDAPLFVGWGPQTQTDPSRVNLHLTGKVLPAGTRVRIVTGLGALHSAKDLYTVYAPVEVTSPPDLNGK